MSDNWQPGDLALCVGKGWWAEPEHRHVEPFGPKRGQIYTVERVLRDRRTWLVFAEFPADYTATAFRKIRPHQRDAEDEETIRLLSGAPTPKELA